MQWEVGIRRILDVNPGSVESWHCGEGSFLGYIARLACSISSRTLKVPGIKVS